MESRRKIERGYVPHTALAWAVEFSSEAMQVFLTDGRILSVPLLWFPRLWAATPEQRTQVEVEGGGVELHWPEIDQDVSVANLMAGADWQSALWQHEITSRLAQWLLRYKPARVV